MLESFKALKTALLEYVLLDIADPTKPFTLEIDACDYAVGVVLSQEDKEGHTRPVTLFSRKLEGSPGKFQIGWSIR